MRLVLTLLIATASTLSACAPGSRARTRHTDQPPGTLARGVSDSGLGPIVIGESFTVRSAVMGESRRINVFMPTVYGEKVEGRLPVLYVLDGGMNEDFLHIAGLVQILVSDGSMRPHLLVGIQNTSRRRDMTGLTQNPEDRKIAPVVGGSATFRRFIKEELMPAVRSRYATTEESAVVGESLAGLFVVETFFNEPDLFRTYIAVDPSLWWNRGDLVATAEDRLRTYQGGGTSLFLTNSNEPTIAKFTQQLAAKFRSHTPAGVRFRYTPMPAETHATIFHPAALLAFRTVLRPVREGAERPSRPSPG
jgi:predicted alpha/beta superfamily hydrolase